MSVCFYVLGSWCSRVFRAKLSLSGGWFSEQVTIVMTKAAQEVASFRGDVSE